MGTSALARIAANMGLLGSVFALVVIVVIASFLLGLIFRFVIGYFPSIPRAVGVVMFTALAGSAAFLVAGWLLPMASNWAALGVALVAGSAWLNQQLLASNGARIGYTKAFLIQLIFFAACLMVWMAFVASTAAVAAAG